MALLVCVVEFLVMSFFQYLIEVFIFKWEFDLLYVIVFALAVTFVTKYYAYKRKNNKLYKV